MKKKEYMIPQSQVVMLQSRASLLSVSDDNVSKSDNETYNSNDYEDY